MGNNKIGDEGAIETGRGLLQNNWPDSKSQSRNKIQFKSEGFPIFFIKFCGKISYKFSIEFLKNSHPQNLIKNIGNLLTLTGFYFETWILNLDIYVYYFWSRYKLLIIL